MLFESKKEELKQKIEKAKSFKNKTKVITHYYKSSFSELRDQLPKHKEELQENWLKANSQRNNAEYDGVEFNKVHNEEEIKPKALSTDHLRSIRSYTQSSKEMNELLRKKDKGGKAQPHQLHLERHIDTLSDAITNRENSNRRAITVFSGVPRSVGETIMKSDKDSLHKFPAFTSTSTDAKTAFKFAKEYPLHAGANKKHIHIIAFHLEPHTGMSIVHHAAYDENEVLLPHGTIGHYSHTEEHPHTSGQTIFVHHMTVRSPQ